MPEEISGKFFRMRNLSWLQLLIGAWIIISPWILGFSSINIALWSCLIGGMLTVIISLWQLFGEDKNGSTNQIIK